MQFGVDDASIALSPNYGTELFHGFHHIDFSDGGRTVRTTVAQGHVAKGTGRTQIAYSGTRSAVQYIVGNGYQGVFLAKHLPGLVNQGQAVHVGIHDHAQVGSNGRHQRTNGCQVLF